MKRFGRYLKRAIVEHPKSTATGLALIVSVVVSGIANPGILATPMAWSGIVTGAGMVAYGPEKKASAEESETKE